MTRGILLFAKDNEKFSYLKQAEICALLAKKYMNNISVCLVTDSIIENSLFSSVINYGITGHTRNFYNNSTLENLVWFNIGRTHAYDLSPFDETIILDTDYLIQTNSLAKVWGSSCPLLINSKVKSLVDLPVTEYVSLFGPELFWATVVYFRKCKETKIFFDLCKHIQDNLDFYYRSYTITGKLFRNDYIFSIAQYLTRLAKPLPNEVQTNAYNVYDIVDVGLDYITFANKETLQLVRTEQNVHVMNKFSLEENLEKFRAIYG